MNKKALVWLLAIALGNFLVVLGLVILFNGGPGDIWVHVCLTPFYLALGYVLYTYVKGGVYPGG